MTDTILVLRGVDSTDELSSLGLKLAAKYASASTVIFIGKNNRPRVVKGKFDLEYIDLASSRAKAAEKEYPLSLGVEWHKHFAKFCERFVRQEIAQK